MDNLNHLNYRVIGNGYPVVFLHGFLESLEMWSYFSLENNFKCILIDLPGHGKSELNRNMDLSMSSMASDVLDIIDSLSIKEFALVGHSMGGYVGLELIFQNDRCKKMVLLNSNFWEDTALKKLDRKRVAEIVKKNKSLFLYEAIPNLFNHPEQFNLAVKKLIEEAKLMDASAIGAASLAMANRKSFESKLSLIENKLLIIQGQFDTIVSLEQMNAALSLFPNVQLKVIESGHMAHIEKSIETEKLIEDFLK